VTGVLVTVVAFAAVVAVGYFYSRQLNARSAELHDRALRELRRVIDEIRLEDESPPVCVSVVGDHQGGLGLTNARLFLRDAHGQLDVIPRERVERLTAQRKNFGGARIQMGYEIVCRYVDGRVQRFALVDASAWIRHDAEELVGTLRRFWS
jgi:hypothetical protein